MRKVMRNRYLKLSMVILLVFALVIPVIPASSDTAYAADAAATVMTNGKIYTVEGNNWDKTPQNSVAVSADGDILYVGNAAGVQAYIGDDTNVIDLKGKAVLPGFGDGHVHPPGTALTELYNIYLYESITKEKVLADVKAYIEANPDLDAYWGSGFTMGIGGSEAEGKGPKKEWLDEICSDKPIILTSNDGHSRWLNSKALEMNGITKDTTHPTGTVQKDANGELWGTLTDASSLITMSQTFTDEQIKTGLSVFQEKMNQWGYTHANMISSRQYALLMKEMEDKDELYMRANIATRFQPSDFQAGLSEFKAAQNAVAGSELVQITTGKFFMDGVVEGMTAYLSEPYDAAAGLDPDFVSVPLWDVNELKGYFDEAMKAGVQIHVHAIGDQAITETIDAMEYAQAQNPAIDARNTITHLQVVKDSDKIRMGDLGIIGSTQPFWHLKEPEWYDYVDEVALGKDRAWKEYPVKSIVDAGAVVTFSGDYPVSPINDPFWAIEAAVTRNLNNAEYYGVKDITNMDDPTWLLNPAERVPVKYAVEAYTINMAYQMYMEDEIGSIKVGKKADMIVLDQDIMTINPIKIDKTNVLATMFDGEFIYEDPQFNNPFTDVPNNWATEGILYSYHHGFFAGTSDTTFSPNTAITRGMAVTVLGRYLDVDKTQYTGASFSDVKTTSYYAPYVKWASEKGIVKGVGNNKFAPDQKINRQEMSIILDGFIKEAGLKLPIVNQNPGKFADDASIATWAKASVAVMQQYELLQGLPGNKFDPLGSLTRAQGALLMMRMDISDQS